MSESLVRHVVVLGHGPGALGGAWRPIAWMPAIERIRVRLALLAADGPIRVHTTLEAGFPLMVAAAVLIARDEGLPITLAVVLPHPLPSEDPEPKAISTWIRRAFARADVRRTAFPRPPRTAPETMGAREEVTRLLFEDAHGVLACWNGRRGSRTWYGLTQAEKRGLPTENMYADIADALRMSGRARAASDAATGPLSGDTGAEGVWQL